MHENNLFSECNTVPPCHNRTNGAIRSKINFKVDNNGHSDTMTFGY